MELNPPEEIKVTNRIVNKSVEAVVEWRDIVERKTFEGLEVFISLKDKLGTVIQTFKAPYADHKAVLKMSEKIPADALMTVSTAAGDTEGDKSDSIQLFGGLDITDPVNIDIEYDVYPEDGKLTALIQWENTASKRM